MNLETVIGIIGLSVTALGVLVAIVFAIFKTKQINVSRKKFLFILCIVIFLVIIPTIWFINYMRPGIDSGTSSFTTEPEVSTNIVNVETNIENVETSSLPDTTEVSTYNTSEAIPSETNQPKTDVNIFLDAKGGNVYPSTISVEYQSNYLNLPTPQRDYYTFLGWYTDINGGKHITEDSVVNDSSIHTLYAHWEENDVSGWVLKSKVPSDAKVIERKWVYTLRETMKSYNSSELGWKLIESKWEPVYSGNHTYAEFPLNSNGNEYYNYSDVFYKQYSDARYDNYEYSDKKRIITDDQIKSYIYYHWSYPLSGYHTEADRMIGNYSGEEIWSKNGEYRGKATLWESFEGAYEQFKSDKNAFKITGHSDYSYWWKGGIPVHIQTYTDYQKAYYYTKETPFESAFKITEGATDKGEILNINEYVRYQNK